MSSIDPTRPRGALPATAAFALEALWVYLHGGLALAVDGSVSS